jgi:hypothetical protein
MVILKRLKYVLKEVDVDVDWISVVIGGLL